LTSRQRRALERCFRRHLRPLSANPDVWRREPPAPGGSYFLPRDGARLRPEDFELGLRDRAEIEATLEAAWRGTPLAGLGRRLVRLSRRFEGTRLKERVSSFVYEMF
jgi:hypothetical protein